MVVLIHLFANFYGKSWNDYPSETQVIFSLPQNEVPLKSLIMGCIAYFGENRLVELCGNSSGLCAYKWRSLHQFKVILDYLLRVVRSAEIPQAICLNTCCLTFLITRASAGAVNWFCAGGWQQAFPIPMEGNWNFVPVTGTCLDVWVHKWPNETKIHTNTWKIIVNFETVLLCVKYR